MRFKKFLESEEVISDVSYDHDRGWGKTPDTANIDYMGMKVIMTPRMFLKLAAELPRDKATSVDDMKEHIESGGAISPAHFYMIFEDAKGNELENPKVRTHEGRNRAYAIAELFGYDTEMLVYILPTGGMRARDITDEMKAKLMKGIVVEKAEGLCRNPIIRIL